VSLALEAHRTSTAPVITIFVRHSEDCKYKGDEFCRRCEEPTDDLLIGTSDGGHSFVQAKRTLSLSSAPDSEFASVMNQFVRRYLSVLNLSGSRPWNRRLDPDRDRLVLVTTTEASSSIRVHLATVLGRARGLVAGQPLSDAATNQSERDALDIMSSHIRLVWAAAVKHDANEADIMRILKLMYVTVLDAEAGGAAEVLALDLLALAIVGHQDQATSAWSRIIAIVADLSQHRSGIDSSALRAMLQPTIPLKIAPSYRDDVEKLKKHSKGHP